MLHTAGRWWAGLWIRSGSGEIIQREDGVWRSISHQIPLHEGGNSTRGPSSDDSALHASVIERAERVVSSERSPCSSRRMRNSGRTRGQRKEKSTGKKVETKMEGTHLEVTVLGRSFCHSSLGARNEETRNSQNESLISKPMI